MQHGESQRTLPDGGMSEHLRQMEELLARLQRVMSASKALMNEHGLTGSQVFILRFLDHCEQAKASDIARFAGLSPGAVTQVCDDLVRMGLVERLRSNDDRRVVYIRITEEGRQRLEKVRFIRGRRILSILNKLGPEDTREFVRLIGRFVEIAESELTKG
ncbi:MarR family transcriptional regulator [Alicyclobacillus sp.]|uniref:MarR family winged helix-turn-helix transcriptional regulator n=1 Tax=Alicyclobacillus sp. TaxID=61169 RepID=UPI0025C19BBE|nr:MarR family transcriptional regulator [Alicyclobacillus sp.]MCL6516561.1 MarR family transcriptional regulator [Alicyclobacillus sp.]